MPCVCVYSTFTFPLIALSPSVPGLFAEWQWGVCQLHPPWHAGYDEAVSQHDRKRGRQVRADLERLVPRGEERGCEWPWSCITLAALWHQQQTWMATQFWLVRAMSLYIYVIWELPSSHAGCLSIPLWHVLLNFYICPVNVVHIILRYKYPPPIYFLYTFNSVYMTCVPPVPCHWWRAVVVLFVSLLFWFMSCVSSHPCSLMKVNQRQYLTFQQFWERMEQMARSTSLSLNPHR